MNKTLRYLFAVATLFSVTMTFAQTYKAKDATYQGSLENGIVWLKDETDYVRFTVNADKEGTADLYIGVVATYGDKVLNWQVGNKTGTANTGEGTGEVKITGVSLLKGNNTILITPNWTWFGVDYIRISGINTSGGGGGNTEVKPTGSFQVSGTQLLDGNGKPFRMMGANLAYAWFKGSGFESQFEAMHRAGANSVRVALSDGDKWNKDSYQTLQAMIQKAEQLKMVLVVEIHDATGSDDASKLQNAANWFVEMKGALAGHESTVIINIANEWMGTWKKYDAYASGYKTAIQTLRNAGLKHCLMVDAAGWGQEVGSLTAQAQNILDSDPLKNVIFSIHMYGTAGAPGRVASNINLVLNRNLCLCIGEFAWYHTDGDVDEDAIISTCKDKAIGWFAWSWWGNGGDIGYIDLVKNQYDENSYYTATANGQSCDWGKKVMDAWKAQAQTCTVYTEQATDIESIENLEKLENLENLEELKIFDIRGNLISNNLNSLTSNISLPKGLYIIVAKSNNKIITRKIFIQ